MLTEYQKRQLRENEAAIKQAVLIALEEKYGDIRQGVFVQIVWEYLKQHVTLATEHIAFQTFKREWDLKYTKVNEEERIFIKTLRSRGKSKNKDELVNFDEFIAIINEELIPNLKLKALLEARENILQAEDQAPTPKTQAKKQKQEARPQAPINSARSGSSLTPGPSSARSGSSVEPRPRLDRSSRATARVHRRESKKTTLLPHVPESKQIIARAKVAKKKLIDPEQLHAVAQKRKSQEHQERLKRKAIIRELKYFIWQHFRVTDKKPDKTKEILNLGINATAQVICGYVLQSKGGAIIKQKKEALDNIFIQEAQRILIKNIHSKLDPKCYEFKTTDRQNSTPIAIIKDCLQIARLKKEEIDANPDLLTSDLASTIVSDDFSTTDVASTIAQDDFSTPDPAVGSEEYKLFNNLEGAVERVVLEPFKMAAQRYLMTEEEDTQGSSANKQLCEKAITDIQFVNFLLTQENHESDAQLIPDEVKWNIVLKISELQTKLPSASGSAAVGAEAAAQPNIIPRQELVTQLEEIAQQATENLQEETQRALLKSGVNRKNILAILQFLKKEEIEREGFIEEQDAEFEKLQIMFDTARDRIIDKERFLTTEINFNNILKILKIGTKLVIAELLDDLPIDNKIVGDKKRIDQFFDSENPLSQELEQAKTLLASHAKAEIDSYHFSINEVQMILAISQLDPARFLDLFAADQQLSQYIKTTFPVLPPAITAEDSSSKEIESILSYYDIAAIEKLINKIIELTPEELSKINCDDHGRESLLDILQEVLNRLIDAEKAAQMLIETVQDVNDLTQISFDDLDFIKRCQENFAILSNDISHKI